MEEIDEEKKQKTELLAIKEFIIEQKYEIRDIKAVVSSLRAVHGKFNESS